MISGAVASGKTTLAEALARLARDHGLTAAAIDIDELTTMVAGRDWSRITPAHRRLACELAASLTDDLFDRDWTLIAIAGSTLSAQEWDDVRRSMKTNPATTYVLLRVSVADAVRRALGDATRGATSDPRVVEALHSRIDWSRVRKPAIEIETDRLSAEEIAATVWSALLPRR